MDVGNDYAALYAWGYFRPVGAVPENECFDVLVVRIRELRILGSFFRAFPFFLFVLVQIMDFFILKELMVKRSGSWLSKALFWIIAVVYFLGFLVSIYGIITSMFRFLWQVIHSLCACIGLSMFSGNIASRPASSGAPRMYEGANGQKFQNSHDAWSHRQQQNNININNKNRGWW